jgi:hypothetical protein
MSNGSSSSRKPDKIEFKMLDYSTVGSDTSSFKLEDGTIVKVKVGLERVGVATNYRNPDGSLHYAINTSVKLYVIPYDKRFTLPSSAIRGQPQPPDPDSSSNKQSPSHFA